jgi:hypothetical protein
LLVAVPVVNLVAFTAKAEEAERAVLCGVKFLLYKEPRLVSVLVAVEPPCQVKEALALLVR